MNGLFYRDKVRSMDFDRKSRRLDVSLFYLQHEFIIGRAPIVAPVDEDLFRAFTADAQTILFAVLENHTRLGLH